MSALALVTEGVEIAENDNNSSSLLAILDRVRDNLTSVRSSAELLEDRASTDFVYDAAKSMARIARKSAAHADVVAKAHRMQADALEMKALADIRLANEYDAAQERGEVVGNKGGGFRWEREKQTVEGYNPKPTAAELGLDKTEIHHARKVRDAENAQPGIIRDTIEALLESGLEPSKAAVGREINARLNSFSGDNEWYTPARYVEMAREVMGQIDLDPASNETAQRTVKAATFYTAETNGLDKPWSGNVWMNPPYSNPEVQQFTDKVIAEFKAGNIGEAIVLTNNSADTGWHRAMQDACTRMCTTTGRIRFESPTRQGNSPAMGQSFFYFGDDPERFKDVFSNIGNVWMLA